LAMTGNRFWQEETYGQQGGIPVPSMATIDKEWHFNLECLR
jgi:hypothetical protein